MEKLYRHYNFTDLTVRRVSEQVSLLLSVDEVIGRVSI